jgi:beta-1,4-mannosyltransferase
MFQYEDLMWLISFPLVCAVMLWFSLDLAVLVRVGSGRRRRANARRAIERLIMSSPVCGTMTVVQSPSPLATSTAPSMAGHASQDRDVSHHNNSNNHSVSSVADDGVARQQQQQQQRYQKARQVVVPAALRIATRAVARRAVVLVGGDFARSPRMQYHAASLARSGLFDEVLLVGLDCGNQLSEDLLISGEPQPECFVTHEGSMKGMEHAVYDVQQRLSSPEVHAGHGCIISTRYLARPPSPPEWFQTIFPLRSLHWVVCTIYRVMALSLLFVVQTGRATATRINEHGQLLVTDLILIQAPPVIPFVLLVKYVVCPLAFVYNVLLYYCVVVPAAWMNPDAMRDMRRECRLQSLRFRINKTEKTQANATHNSAAAKSSDSGTVVSRRQRVRPWVFYPAIVVDWHNFGYTILEQNQRPTTAVQLYKLLEVHLCAGHVNITVSRAMQKSLEHFYPWLQRRTPPTVSLEKAVVVDNDHTHTSLSDPASSGVTVLYDVAPSFFRPLSRRRCVREVLDRLLRRNLTNQNSPIPTANNDNNNSSSNSNSNGPYTLVGMSELESMGWGIAGPPAWVYADAAVESAASPLGSPSSPAPPSSAFGPSLATPFTTASTTPRRGVVMVGSTSWTEDDDYSVLLRALRRLDHRLNHAVSTYRSVSVSNSSNIIDCNGRAAPLDLWVLITGKGAARERFENAVRAAKLSSHVVVSTYYAQSYQEYSVLLGSADVGFCLHFSSSGLDLPMKGVDMVGAGLPVIALQYPAIEELMGGVTRVLTQARTVPGTNGSTVVAPPALVECERGWVFRSDVDLEALLSSFVGLPVNESTRCFINETVGRGAGSINSNSSNCDGSTASPSGTLAPTPLSVMKRKAQEARLHASTWGENWTKVLLPVLKQVV